MKPIKKNPTLADYQQYIRDMIIERGFTDTTIPELFMYLAEETGELAKAARQATDMHCDDSSAKMEVAHEIADVFEYIIDIANHLDIDLEQAFRDKETINDKRTWKKKGEH